MMSFSMKLITTAVAGSFAVIGAAQAETPQGYTWNSADVPVIESGDYSFTGKDVSSLESNFFSPLYVTTGASGTLENLKLNIEAIGPNDGKNQDKQVIGLESVRGSITLAGSSLDISLKTDFVGGGNNQATAIDFYGSDGIISAETVNLTVTSTAENGKSVYGIGRGGSGTLTVSSKEVNINLSTATNRDPEDTGSVGNNYSEAIGVDVSGGQLISGEDTTWNIHVVSTGADTTVTGTDGGSPAYGFKFEGGQGVISGTVNATVESEGGTASAVGVTNYFYNTTLGENWNDSGAKLNNVNAKASSKTGTASAIAIDLKEGQNENTVILQVEGDAVLEATTETGTANAISVNGATTAILNGNVTASASATGEGGVAHSIWADEGTLTFAGSDNQFTGDVAVSNKASVTFGADDATAGKTFIDGNVSAAEGTALKVKNQTLTLGEGKTLNAAGTLSGTNAVIVYDNADKNAVEIADNQIANLQVLASARLNDMYGADQQLIDAVSVTSTGTGSSVTGAEAGTVSGAWTVDADGTIRQEANYSMEALQQFNNATLVQWRNEVNHLSQRLGDVRANRGEIGGWARIYGSDTKVTDHMTTEIKANTVQVGADAVVADNWIVGGAFSYTNMDGDITNGSADGETYSLAAYASGFFDCGGYVDIVGRIGRLSTDVEASNLSSAANFNGSYDNTAFGLSVETGYHWNFAQSFYLEPQAELAYGYIMGDDFTASNGVKVEQDDFQSLVGRLGMRLGAAFPQNAGSIYLHASVNHEFLGDNDFDATPAAGAKRHFDSSLDGTWVSYGVGLQINASDAWYLYGSLERANGDDYQDDYRYSVGARYVF